MQHINFIGNRKAAKAIYTLAAVLMFAIFIWLTAASINLVYYARATHQSEQPLQCDSTTHDFGDVGQNEKHDTIFVLHNSNTKPITIFDINKTCSCTNVVLSKNFLQENEEATLKLSWETRQSSGFKNVPLTLLYSCDDSTPKQLELSIKANIEPDFMIVPPDIILHPWSNIATVAINAGRLPAPAQIQATASSPAVKVDIEKNKLKITLIDPNEFVPGQYIQVETISDKPKTIKIPLIVTNTK